MDSLAADPADADRRAAFDAAARAVGMDPAGPWAGGYAAYEWEHLRPVLCAYGVEPAGCSVLEFGSNVGASGVVLARLGATVTGVDVDPGMVRVANANFALKAVEQQARAIHVADTRTMPFPDGHFDLALANSVLEYVDPAHLDAVVRELHRVVKPGGHALILGTASRLAPREVHSRRWLTNYVPRALDGLFRKPPQRGLSPLALRRSLQGRFAVRRGGQWLAARGAVHGKTGRAVRAVDWLARLIGVPPGWLGQNIELLLERV